MPIHDCATPSGVRQTSEAADVEPTKATPDEETIRMASCRHLGGTSPISGNMDLPRTSDDVHPIHHNQTPLTIDRADLENFLKDEYNRSIVRIANVCTTLQFTKISYKLRLAQNTPTKSSPSHHIAGLPTLASAF